VTRVLVVNADDFGRSHGINRGVALAHDRGIVTSASAMVCWPAAEEAAELARQRPRLSVGLHVDLGEWTYEDGRWSALYRRAAEDAGSVAGEFEAQLTRFRELFGRSPTHLDSHQHVHREEPLRSILIEAGRRFGIPVRELTPAIVYRGDFYGQTAEGEPLPDAIGLESLVGLLSSLPDGITELGCHPAAEPELGSSYATPRPHELEVLCDPRLRAAVQAEGIELSSFAGVSSSLAPGVSG
jgi:predicted glycoside hydrolase/deacetylase ChbG (UPF0249 family)